MASLFVPLLFAGLHNQSPILTMFKFTFQPTISEKNCLLFICVRIKKSSSGGIYLIFLILIENQLVDAFQRGLRFSNYDFLMNILVVLWLILLWFSSPPRKTCLLSIFNLDNKEDIVENNRKSYKSRHKICHSVVRLFFIQIRFNSILE